MSFKKILLIVFIVLSIITLGGMLIVYSFIEIKLSSIDGKGELVETVESPNRTYQAETYIVYGNTSNQDQVRVSITDVANKIDLNDTTVYWLYPKGKELPKVEWLSENKLEIADKKIDITDTKTYYNYQKDKKLNK